MPARTSENYCPGQDSEYTIRIAATLLGFLAVLVAGAAIAVHYLPITNHVVLVAAVASPYLLLAAPIGALLLAFSKRWVLASVAATTTVCAVLIQLPLFVGSAAPNHSSVLRVMTANVFLGQTDADSLAATATREADILSVQELTPAQVARLHAAGLDTVFPHRVLDARDGANGGGIWSRYPIVSSETFPEYKLAMVSARVRVEGVKVDPTIVVAHMSGPWPQPISDWQDDLARMRGTMRHVASSAGDGCVAIAGDFNSTLDMSTFRKLLTDGFHDGADQAGAGMTLTYPGNNARIPPFMAIDHVLTSHCVATSVRVVELPGSDHRGLVAAVAIPR